MKEYLYQPKKLEALSQEIKEKKSKKMNKNFFTKLKNLFLHKN